MFQLDEATETTKSYSFNFWEIEAQRGKKGILPQGLTHHFNSLCASCCPNFQQYLETRLVSS